MVSDDLDERVRQAGEVDSAVVDRLVRAALESDATARAAWPRAFAALAACLVAVVALGAWWVGRRPAPPAGVYRVQATTEVASEGVFQVEANQSLAPPRVIQLTSDGGATWILSTTPEDNRLPPGSAIVIGGGEVR